MDITVLREALPYIKRFKDKVFVIKLGGRVVEDLDALRCLMRDVTLLSLIGVKVIIVHGGGAQANQLLKDLHHESRIVNGRRVTDAKTLEVAKMVYGGTVNVEILSALRNNGARGVGLSGVDADLITIMKAQSKSLSLMGNFTQILLNRATIPVLTLSNKETHIMTGFSTFGG